MGKPLKTLVIEDEAVIAETLRMMLEDLGYIVPDPALSPKEGMETALREQPDIILLDVNLNSDIDGIELGALIKEEMDVPIVFITSYADAETIERAKLVSPAGYIVKPFTSDDIYAAIEIAMVQYRPKVQTFSPDEVTFLFVKCGTSYIKLNPAEIDFMRSAGIYIEVNCGEKKWLIRDSFETMIERLAQHKKFMRVHKSYCVNIERIDSIDTESLKVGQFDIPLARSKKNELFKVLGIS